MSPPKELKSAHTKSVIAGLQDQQGMMALVRVRELGVSPASQLSRATGIFLKHAETVILTPTSASLT